MSDDIVRSTVPAVTPLIQVANELDRVRQGFADEDNALGLLRLWQSVEDVASQLRDVVANCESDLLQMHDRGVWADGDTLDGDIMAVKPGTVKKKWDSGRLLNQVIRRSIDPSETGEMPEPGELIARVLEGLQECLSLTATTPWKSTGLKNLRIWQDDFMEIEHGRRRVDIKRVP